MASDKPGVSDLASLLHQGGVAQAVISPGSRNAPLIIALDHHPHIECIVVPDERSAAFTALGMSLASGKPVALVCTSGSAMLNYGPAVSEAFYQNIPLILLTADRPVEAIDKGMGQTIRQRGALDNHLVYSAELLQEPSTDGEIRHNTQLISQALANCYFPKPGPIHINIPFREPLYDSGHSGESKARLIQLKRDVQRLPEEQIGELAKKISSTEKVLIMAGQMSPETLDEQVLDHILDLPQVALLTETTSNIPHVRAIPGIDKTIDAFSEDQKQEFSPDLLITFGNAIISKKVKAWLKNHAPEEHWHISPSGYFRDTFDAQTEALVCEPASWLTAVSEWATSSKSEYSEQWHGAYLAMKSGHADFMRSVEWSDMLVYDRLRHALPNDCAIHWGNSSPVRYAQLFEWPTGVKHFGNRGASGIDGSVSTAVGYARNRPDEHVVLVTGDVGFFYDSNGLWQSLPENLTILMIHNGGGGIFRIIPGPGDTGEDSLKKYFETRHDLNAGGIASTFGLNYEHVGDSASLDDALSKAFGNKTGNPVLIEANTSKIDNAGILKAYFRHLKSVN